MSSPKYTITVLDNTDVACYKYCNTKKEVKTFLKTLPILALSQVTELSFKKHALCNVKVSAIASVTHYQGNSLIEYKLFLELLKELRRLPEID